MCDEFFEILPFLDKALKEFWDEEGDEGFCFGNQGYDVWMNEWDDEDDEWDDNEEEYY